MADREVIAGVDVGGSKTHLRCEDVEHGTVLLDTVLDSEDWIARTTGQRATVLAGLVEQRMLPLGNLVGLAAGVHGNDCPEQRATFEAHLARVCPSVAVVNDAELLVPAAGYDSGAGVIAGTGSSATARRTDGMRVTIGGWGWLLGDEGGATGVVRDAVRAVQALHDAAMPDPLPARLMHALGVAHPRLLTAALVEQAPRQWAQAAHVVFHAAYQDASAAASEVIRRHTGILAGLVCTIAQRGGVVDRVVVGGGVFAHQPAYLQGFGTEVHRLIREVQDVVLVPVAPVHGAICLARDLARERR